MDRGLEEPEMEGGDAMGVNDGAVCEAHGRTDPHHGDHGGKERRGGAMHAAVTSSRCYAYTAVPMSHSFCFFRTALATVEVKARA
jgi:hypothetical protein